MNLLDISVNQLRRAAAIKEQMEALNRELRSILGGAENSGSVAKKKRTMSAAVKKRIAAARRARWAKIKASKAGRRSVKVGEKAKAK